MKTRVLSLPRGSGPVLRVLVVEVDVRRRRKLVARLLAQAMPACAVRALFKLSPAAFARVLSRLPHRLSASAQPPARREVPLPPPLWAPQQLLLFQGLEGL